MWPAPARWAFFAGAGCPARRRRETRRPPSVGSPIDRVDEVGLVSIDERRLVQPLDLAQPIVDAAGKCRQVVGGKPVGIPEANAFGEGLGERRRLLLLGLTP